MGIQARVSVVTKASLDTIQVTGSCECGEKPLVELVFLIDGSDSYNNPIGDSGARAFEKTMDLVISIFKGIVDDDRAIVSFIQFSGIQQLEKDYQPGGDGTVADLPMYKFILEPTYLGDRDNIHRYENSSILN